METTCSSLLSELQKLWDEVGEADTERDRMLFDLEQECLGAYKRKVDQASHYRVKLRQAVGDAEAQIADICSALGERPSYVKKMFRNLKEELEAITPQLDVMKKKRNERKGQFTEVQTKINSISRELSGFVESNLRAIVDESDLSMKRLDDLRNQLLLLQREKEERLKKVLDQMNVLQALCLVLGMDFKSTIQDVHQTLDESPSLKCISVDTMKSLSATIFRLKNVKLQRLQRLQDLAMTMVELWNLMDTPLEEQQMFQNVTCSIAASENEVMEPNSLSLELINDAESEVMRLQNMKSSKIKELLLRRKSILEEICQGAHVVVDGKLVTNLSMESIESGAINPADLLERLDVEISNAKEEAFSRKDFIEKVQKWLATCEEEDWLEEYNRDGNRYSAGRGAHLMLKRAEKARLLVNKIPAMVDALKLKAKTWEGERKAEFLYDGVRLSSMLERYCELKHLKEQERRRERDQKKLQGQLMAEQEAIYGAKPCPSWSVNKNSRPSTVGVADKRLSLGGAALQKKLADKATLSSRSLLNNRPVNRQLSHSHRDTGSVSYSSGKSFHKSKKKISGLAAERYSSNSSNPQHPDSLPLRKALSPLSSLSPNIMSYNLQGESSKSTEVNEAHTMCKTPFSTPPKTGSTADSNSGYYSNPVIRSAMQMSTTPFNPVIRSADQV